MDMKASLHVATYEGGGGCFGTWSSYMPRALTPGNFSGKISLAGATHDEGDTNHGVMLEL